MTSQAPLTAGVFAAPRVRRSQVFFDALGHIEYGHLTLVTPEGAKLEFSGPRSGPSAHLRLYEWHVLEDFLARGEMGFAENYIDGNCASENLPELLTFALLNAQVLEKFFYGGSLYICLTYLRQLLRRNSLWGAKRNMLAHYDLGNEFYALWLDKGMTYSCALFDGDASRSLEEAQAAKYTRVLDKLGAEPGQHILDIGCGWGGFVELAARCGIRVTGITLSPEQAGYARARIQKAGLSELANIEELDYRKVSGQYDHIVSIGMFEHVGDYCWASYFAAIKKHLKPGGRAVIQSTTINDALFQELHNYSGFMEQVIFPGGMLPSQPRFCEAAKKEGLQCEESFAFGADYIRTLQCWQERFHAHREDIKALGYDESFLRLWRFYLSSCIASFASGRTDVMQVLVTHET